MCHTCMGEAGPSWVPLGGGVHLTDNSLSVTGMTMIFGTEVCTYLLGKYLVAWDCRYPVVRCEQDYDSKHWASAPEGLLSPVVLVLD